MIKVLKVLHLIGLAVFLGSIPAHIVLGQLGNPQLDPAGFALLMHAKYINVLALTLPGLVLMLLSGVPLAWRRGMTPAKHRWMAVKLVLVTLIALNAALVLRPLSRDIASAAQGFVSPTGLPADLAVLERKESLFGAANLAMVLVVIVLAVAKPRLRVTARSLPGGAGIA